MKRMVIASAIASVIATAFAGAAQAKPIDQWTSEDFTVAAAACTAGEGGAVVAGTSIVPPVAGIIFMMCLLTVGDLYSEGDIELPAPRGD